MASKSVSAYSHVSYCDECKKFQTEIEGISKDNSWHHSLIDMPGKNMQALGLFYNDRKYHLIDPTKSIVLACHSDGTVNPVERANLAQAHHDHSICDDCATQTVGAARKILDEKKK